MNIEINGKSTAVPDKVTVMELLTLQKVKMPDMVSVELNGEILPREQFEGSALKEGDKVEFLYFMGGGGECSHVGRKGGLCG